MSASRCNLKTSATDGGVLRTPALKEFHQGPPDDHDSGVRHAGALAVAVCVSLIVILSWSVWTSRRHQLRDGSISTYTLAQTLAGSANATIKQADVALLGLVERLENEGRSPRQLLRLEALMKNQRKQLPQLHGLFVYDESGRWLVNSNGPAPSGANNADRGYFIHHRDHVQRSAYVGPPVRSRSTNAWIFTVSRRIDHPDGSFAGIVLATLSLDYFSRLYQSLDIGDNGVITLALDHGTIMVRRPFFDREVGADVSSSPIFSSDRLARRSGVATSRSVVDGVERVSGYQHLDDYPLVMFVAREKSELLAKWRRESLTATAIVAFLLLLLSIQGYRLFRLLRQQARVERQLRTAQSNLLQANEELEILARVDGLTGLLNRREFDFALQGELRRAKRAAASLGLLILDVDYFKAYNDLYGHLGGDACLRQIAQAINANVGRYGDIAARYGGEEFVVILPGASLEQAGEMAEKIRKAVCALGVPHAGAPNGVATVSVGVSAVVPTENTDAAELIAVADKALYAAKAAGRNTWAASGLQAVSCTEHP
jgi:diguanylate cyclase (GGDEF)-like protein